MGTCVLLGLPPRAAPDTPGIPSDDVICSRDSEYCLVTLVSGVGNPKIRASYSKSGFYKAPTAARPQPTFLWHSELDPSLRYLVLRDGEHLVGVRSGAALPGPSLGGQEVALRFLSNATAVRTWTVAEAVPGWSKLQPMRSVSHYVYHWFCRVELARDERTLEITPCPA